MADLVKLRSSMVSILAVILLTIGSGAPVASAQNVYWTDWGTNKIQRSNLDGSNVEDILIIEFGSPKEIALDPIAGKMYWALVIPLESTDKIQRADLDGSNIEDLVTSGLATPHGVALDVRDGKMYWTDRTFDKIQRANLDGSDVEDLITDEEDSPGPIALDLAAGKMYWILWPARKIRRANLDGSNIEDLVTTGLVRPIGIALDVDAGKMYWTDCDTDWIKRANLDGSDPEIVIAEAGLNCPSGIALDEDAGKIYWTESPFLGPGRIRRADLDGSRIEDLVTNGLGRPGSITLLLTEACLGGDDGQVMICHIPPGNPENAHTITVSERAVPAHLGHGDHCGPCEEDSGLINGGSSDLDKSECVADLDGSGDVGAADLAQLLGTWTPSSGHLADIDADGMVDAVDLAKLLRDWGACP